MKISALFVTVAFAAKDNSAAGTLERMKKHVNTVWDTWYAGVGVCDKRVGQRDRYIGYMETCERLFNRCGSEGGRRRRDVDCTDPDEMFNPECGARLSKTDRSKAAGQLARVIKNFSADFLSGCNETKTKKLLARATKLSGRLQDGNCRA